MQDEITTLQADIEARDFSATSGGGAVEVTVSGTKEIKNLKLSPDVVDPDDIEMLQDLIVAALNEAFAQVDKASGEAMSKLTGGLGGLPF